MNIILATILLFAVALYADIQLLLLVIKIFGFGFTLVIALIPMLMINMTIVHIGVKSFFYNEDQIMNIYNRFKSFFNRKSNVLQIEQDIMQNIEISKENSALLAIRNGSEFLIKIKKAAEYIKNGYIRQRVDIITQIGFDIIKTLQSNNDNISLANTWLNVYLSEFLNIVKKCGDLTQNGYKLSSNNPVMLEIDDTLNTFQNLFHEVQNKIEKSNIQSFSVDMQVIKSVIRSEGH